MNAKSIPPFSSEVFAQCIRSRADGQSLIIWAEAMLLAGFNSEHLNVLVGETPPFNGFEMNDLLKRSGQELNVPLVASTAEAVEIVATACIKRHSIGWVSRSLTLSALASLALDEEVPKEIYDFYLLNCAVDDLAYGGLAYHWMDANHANIDQIIQEKFDDWLLAHPLANWQAYEWADRQQHKRP